MYDLELERGLTAFEAEGKKLLRYFVICFIYYEFYFAFYVGYAGGEVFQASRFIRFALTLLLLYCLYNGWMVAKWIAIIAYSISGAIGIYYSLTVDGFIASLPLVSITAFSIAFVCALIFSKQINAFLAFQRLAKDQASID